MHSLSPEPCKNLISEDANYLVTPPTGQDSVSGDESFVVDWQMECIELRVYTEKSKLDSWIVSESWIFFPYGFAGVPPDGNVPCFFRRFCGNCSTVMSNFARVIAIENIDAGSSVGLLDSLIGRIFGWWQGSSSGDGSKAKKCIFESVQFSMPIRSNKLLTNQWIQDYFQDSRFFCL